ncbi:GtrA family protein [Lonsdalea quercina]|uniref:GtrA family protein n=1 Tax=Lonsdalea quercina TaxID=71657 RepID=UPI0039769B7C
MLRLIARYMSVGVLNTLLHWAVFSALYMSGQKQFLSNFIAFCVAVTFSFFANARWTFTAEATTARYTMYVVFMGALAALIGGVADVVRLNPICTLIVFSALSLVCGFIYSRYVVFKVRK